MLDDFRPMGLDDLAARVGVDPLEAVRLLVVAGATTADQLYTPAHAEQIGTAGGVATWWKGPPPTDDNAARGHVRGALQMLIDGGFVGEKGARIDNLWRGLASSDAEPIRDAVDLLVAEGILLLAHTQAGPMVSIASRAQPDVSRIAQGSLEPAALAAVWKR